MTDTAGAPPWMAAWLATQRDFAAIANGLPLADQYRRLFAAPEPPAAMSGAEISAPAVLRYREALQRFGELLSAIASDAGRRLASALADDGSDAPPITSLRELHALWIECGEAAWSAAAHGEEFAAAQAHWLVALIELRAAGVAR
jgi:hypothetical protein